MLLGASGAAHEATAQIREGTQEGFRCSDASFHYRYFSVIRVPQGIEVTLEQDGLAQPIVKNERGA
jgi:hypothetical protein